MDLNWTKISVPGGDDYSLAMNQLPMFLDFLAERGGPREGTMDDDFLKKRIEYVRGAKKYYGSSSLADTMERLLIKIPSKYT